MALDGFMSVQKGKDNMNTLITWNQLREMEEAAQNLQSFPGRISEQSRLWGDAQPESRRLVTGG